LHGHGRSFQELVELARRLLHDHDFYEQQCAALEVDRTLSFTKAIDSMSRWLPNLA